MTLRKYLISIVLLLVPLYAAHSNIRAINYKNIPDMKTLEPGLDLLFNYEYTYKNWTDKWQFKIPKKDILENLKLLHNEVLIRKKKDPKNLDTILLIGMIEHFLYNLEEQEYYERAIQTFVEARKIDENDYRADWFLGNHYIKSAKNFEGMNLLIPIMKNIPYKDLPPFFWEDFAIGASLGFMHSHSILALDHAKVILGKPSELDLLVGKNFRKILISSDLKEKFEKKDLWRLTSNNDTSKNLTSRILGISIEQIPDTWQLQISDYENGQAFINLKPFSLKGKNNMNVSYTISVLAKRATKDESFEKFFEKISNRFPKKKMIQMTGKYKTFKAFELKDPQVYKEQGGAIFKAIAFERSSPSHPGIALEKPINHKFEAGMKYYRAVEQYTRFSNNIYYFLSFDTCEGISEESQKVFDEFLNDKLTIE